MTPQGSSLIGQSAVSGDQAVIRAIDPASGEAREIAHGPATSDARTTSVGSAAIRRFLRPVCYQNLPAGLLPEALQDDNPFNVTRLVDGKRE